MLRISSAVFILGMFLYPPGFGVIAPDEQIPNQKDIIKYVEEQKAALNIPGLSLSVYYKGKRYTNSWGKLNVELNVPCTNDAVFELASLSKPLVATAAVLLTREPKPPFRLEDKVRDFLPELPTAWGNITVRHLLSHLSGIKEYLLIPEFLHRQEYSASELLSLACRYPLDFAPGSQFNYSNTNYCILTMLIERTTKKSYNKVLREKIFKPLRMESTRVNDSTEVICWRAAGYAHRFGRYQHADFVARSQLAFGDCGVISTMNDLVRWDNEMWNLVNFPKDLLQQMWTVQLNDGNNYGYGLGWDLYLDKNGKVNQVAHGGEIEGFRSIIRRYLSDELSVIVLFNCELEHDKNYYFARDIADLVVGRKVGSHPVVESSFKKRHVGLTRY